MAAILKLQDASSTWRQFITSLRSKPRKAIIQDEQNRDLGVVLSMEEYLLYEQEWEKDFAAVDRIQEKMKGYNSAYVEKQIDLAKRQT